MQDGTAAPEGAAEDILPDVFYAGGILTDEQGAEMVEGVDDYVDAEGTRIQTPYMGVFEFEDGKIRNWRDYVDLGLVKMIKDGDGLPDWVKPLVA